LAGSLDRAVDVAATLELRGYSLGAPTTEGATRFSLHGWRKRYAAGRPRSRYDRRFYAVGVVILIIAIAGKALGADGFSEYPATEIDSGGSTLAVAAMVALSGLAPLRRRSGRTRSVFVPPRSGPSSLPAGRGI
jgi:hypothetical protein